MTIRENILAVQTRAEKDAVFAADIKNQAIEAIYAGMDNANGAWVKYMSNFVDNPPTAATETQLARLTTTVDDRKIKYLRSARAYLVGNAVCFPGTQTTVLQGIDHLLDQQQ